MVIRVVVEASDVQTAVDAGQRYFENYLHMQEGGPFDYCTPMVEGHTVSGSDRWIDYEDEQAAFPLASDPGRAEVEDAWAATQDYMEDNLEKVLEAADECEDAADLRDRVLDDGMLSYYMSQAGSGQSTDKFLYVQGWSASGLDSYSGWNHVQELMEEEEQNEDNRWWVVPLDVHY
jgi:hypothetical protein